MEFVLKGSGMTDVSIEVLIMKKNYVLATLGTTECCKKAKFPFRGLLANVHPAPPRMRRAQIRFCQCYLQRAFNAL